VVRQPDCFVFEVESAKNNPYGFSFKVPINPARPSCVGQFMADFIVKAGIIIGDKNSFFAFKVSQVKGILKAVPATKVGSSTMRAACKRLIAAVGLDPMRMRPILASAVGLSLRWSPAFPRSRSRILVVGRAPLWSVATPEGTQPFGRRRRR
jgi:hypothetical protein